MVEKRNVNTAIILIDQKRRRISHKPNARPPLDTSQGSMRNWRRSCEDCQSARLRPKSPKKRKEFRCEASCIHNIGNNGTRTAKIAVDDAVLLHKFSSEISVDKFLAGIPFPVRVRWTMTNARLWAGRKRHANFPASFQPFGHSNAFGALVASSDPQSWQIILKIL